MLTTTEAAGMLGVSRRRVLALIATGDLQAERFGPAWMVNEDSVRQRLASPRPGGRPKYAEKDARALASYTLMNRDREVLDFIYRFPTQTVAEILEHKDIAYAPLGALSAPGRPTAGRLGEWIRHRQIPVERPHLREALRELRLGSSTELLFANLGLSLSDQYWFKPQGVELDWHELNFFQNGYQDRLGLLMLGGKGRPRGKGEPAYSPSAGTPGQLTKWWEKRDDRDYLLKGGDIYDREPYNELLATRLYQALLADDDFVPYTLEQHDGHAYSCCPCFINERTELVTMSDVMTCHAPAHRKEDYRVYADACETLGVHDIRHKLACMIVCDFLTANADRHDQNLGLIRDAQSLEWLGAAPLYDNGRAFYYSARNADELRGGLLFYQSTPFSPYPTTQLALVEEYRWYEPDRLTGFGDTIREVLAGNPNLAPDYIDAVTCQFVRRLDRVNEVAREHRPLSIAF
jgi:excisionase family DNA binding protein